MAGKTSPQITAAAPAPTPSAPSAPAEVIATGNIVSPSTPPPAPVETQAPKAKAKKADKAQNAPAPENAPDTSATTDAAFQAKVRALEGELNGKVQEGKAETGKEKATTLKVAEKDKAKEADPLQDELDEAAEVAGLKVAKADEPKEESKEEAKGEKVETEEVEPPDTGTDEYTAWKKTLSKPAAKKIDQLERKAARNLEAAAERIVLNPTVEAPLSNVTNLEQLEATTAYWKDIRSQAKSGGPVKIQTAEGKKLELDPEVEEDRGTIERYLGWAEAAIEAAPDAKERIKGRASSKPWEAAEKLAPGMISDKDSFAQKKALEVLKANPLMIRDPNYEVHLGHMVRSYQMDEDAKPTEAFPKGTARWVRLPLDKEGNVIPPKKAVSSTKDAAKKAPTASDSKPLNVSRVTEVDTSELRKRAESGDEDAYRALVAAKERRERAA